MPVRKSFVACAADAVALRRAFRTQMKSISHARAAGGMSGAESRAARHDVLMRVRRAQLKAVAQYMRENPTHARIIGALSTEYRTLAQLKKKAGVDVSADDLQWIHAAITPLYNDRFAPVGAGVLHTNPGHASYGTGNSLQVGIRKYQAMKTTGKPEAPKRKQAKKPRSRTPA